MQELCWFVIHQHLTSVGLMFFNLQVFLKVAEEADAEEEGIITKLAEVYSSSLKTFVAYLSCLLNISGNIFNSLHVNH